MKVTLTVILLIVFMQAAYAVHNVVVSDIPSLERNGFAFEAANYPSTKKSLGISVLVPLSYTFEDQEKKPFSWAAYFKPEDSNATGTSLIGAEGLRLPLSVTKEKHGHSLRLAVLTGEAAGTYLEFGFNQGSGHAPMLIHVPVQAVIDHLVQKKKAAPGADGKPHPPQSTKPSRGLSRIASIIEVPQTNEWRHLLTINCAKTNSPSPLFSHEPVLYRPLCKK